MENFVVSARKYRPSTFISVVGQSHITSTLCNAISRNQLAHAYLFCGPRGVGKTTCARIFAKNINCTSPVNGEACEQCESCRSFNEGRSFSIHELDAASNNSVEDIRNLTEQVRIPPQTGRYSVYIIDEVHMLSQAAFNAFLKTLEEPPAHAIFILATTEKHKILPTILSRCQIYDFNRIRVEDTVGYLKHIAEQEGVSYDDESLNIIARKADGGMRDALSMFDKVVSFCDANLSAGQVAETLNMLDYDTYFKMMEIILEGDYQAALLEFDRILSNGFSGETLVSGLSTHMRDLLMCKDLNTLGLLEVTGSVAERYREQSLKCPVPLLFESISLLSSLDTGHKAASNQRLYFELGLMKLCGLGQKKNNDTLTAELPPLVSAQAASKVPSAGSIDVVKKEPSSSVVAKEPVMPASPAATIPVKETVTPATSTSATTTPVASIPAATTPAEESVSPAVVTAEKEAADSPSANLSQTRVMASPTTSSSEMESPLRPQATSMRHGVSISGKSLSSIMDGSADEELEQSVEEVDLMEQGPIDPQIEEKLEKACQLFSRENEASRPRISLVFKSAVINNNMVQVQVANKTLQDEINNNRLDILARLTQLGDISCFVDLDVQINEKAGKVRPIKLEDRVNHMMAKNPELLNLKNAFDMEMG